MLKKLLLLCVACFLTMSAAFASSVDVNTADQTTLESLKGLGPVKSKAILDERAKNGPFKDADDLANRVKGLGTKSVTKLEAEGLTIGGSSAPPTGAGSKSTKSTMGTMSPAASAPAAKAMSKSTAPSTTAAASTSTAASAPMAASGGKASKKSKKGKAASAAAASGG
ncbi:ComEA family DNA-binding protein [Trinickia mobilis]|uniref:ComEA family DNA-binding protein n=1 Tax=Trinickia mobilis TaxID=2816356 RepID=UPI001A8D37C8|nr:helix-hairpin-helix domain-containing protein [Trinickia mobilis]